VFNWEEGAGIRTGKGFRKGFKEGFREGFRDCVTRFIFLLYSFQIQIYEFQ